MISAQGGGEGGQPAGPAVTIVRSTRGVEGTQELDCRLGVCGCQVVAGGRGSPVGHHVAVRPDTRIGAVCAVGEVALVGVDECPVRPGGGRSCVFGAGGDGVQQGEVGDAEGFVPGSGIAATDQRPASRDAVADPADRKNGVRLAEGGGGQPDRQHRPHPGRGDQTQYPGGIGRVTVQREFCSGGDQRGKIRVPGGVGNMVGDLTDQPGDQPPTHGGVRDHAGQIGLGDRHTQDGGRRPGDLGECGRCDIDAVGVGQFGSGVHARAAAHPADHPHMTELSRRRGVRHLLQGGDNQLTGARLRLVQTINDEVDPRPGPAAARQRQSHRGIEGSQRLEILRRQACGHRGGGVAEPGHRDRQLRRQLGGQRLQRGGLIQKHRGLDVVVGDLEGVDQGGPDQHRQQRRLARPGRTDDQPQPGRPGFLDGREGFAHRVGGDQPGGQLIHQPGRGPAFDRIARAGDVGHQP